MKNQEGFIQIPFLVAIIVSVLVVGNAGYFGTKQYQAYQAEIDEKDKQIQELSAQRQQTANDTKSGRLNADALFKNGKTISVKEPPVTTQKSQKTPLVRYTKDTTILFIKTGEKAFSDAGRISRGTQVKLIFEGSYESKVEVDGQEFWVSNSSLVVSTPPNRDLSDVIKQWQPITAYVECDFRDLNTGELYSQVRGSGVVVDFDTQITLITNRHIIVDDYGYQPYTCRIKLPYDDNTFIGQKFMGGGTLLDVGLIDISNPNDYIRNITSVSSSSFLNQCKIKPSLGDSVLILGYPTIGSQTDITVTEGIISGYDGDYYITSAKIDHGNSGGAAILVNDNCYLGIPSASVVGEIESLGRILNIRVMRGEN